MTTKKPSLITLMREDAAAALARDPAAENIWDIVLFSTGTRIVWSYRKAHWLWTHGAHKLALFMAKRTRRRLGADIHPGATIGRRFTIDHGFGVVIGGTAIIGNDCMMYQGVTLGMTGKCGAQDGCPLGVSQSLRNTKRHPTVGNNVLFGAGAIVLGNITIGNDAKVAAGAVVLHNVRAHSTVAGVPAKEVKSSNLNVTDTAHTGKAALLRMVGSSTPREAAAQNLDDENIRWSCAL